MREILFRGKRVDNGEWVYGYYAVFTGKNIIYVDWKAYEVIPESIGQFTGLLDKNGNKIYEGDILKSNSYNKTWIVDFTPCDGLKLAIKYDSEFENSGIVQTHEEWRYNKASTCEIIGNIHNK